MSGRFPADAQQRSVDGRELRDVEVVQDRTDELGPRDGFLQLRRLVVRNTYTDGSVSDAYPCDIVSRRFVDAVTVVLYQRSGEDILVGLRENLRVPIWLRRSESKLPFPDEPRFDTILETVAGVIETQDADEGDLRSTLRSRAAAEAFEEVGMTVPEDAILDLGGASFPSPGITDEKVFFCAAEVDFSAAEPPRGDGSVMEEVGGLVVLTLSEALDRCRDGRIGDMKTEIALRRLQERLEQHRPQP